MGAGPFAADPVAVQKSKGVRGEVEGYGSDKKCRPKGWSNAIINTDTELATVSTQTLTMQRFINLTTR